MQQPPVERHVLQRARKTDPRAVDFMTLHLGVLCVCSAVENDGGRAVGREVCDSGYLQAHQLQTALREVGKRT
jgi:hypothetical protein